MKCNGHGHAADCNCGYGGVYYPSASGASTERASIPASGTRATWEHSDFCRRSTCPKCRQPVFFVRHNGGSVWFDSLGVPWEKHPCMASESDTAWLHEDLPDGIEPGNRLVFGVIRQATVGDSGYTAWFVIDCSDGTVIDEEFVYQRLNPCDAVGSLVKLELSPDNRVGERRFKLIDELRAAEKALRIAEHSRGARREREETERAAILLRLTEAVQQQRGAERSGFADVFYDGQIESLQKKSLKTLRALERSGLKGLDPRTISLSHNCKQGTIKLRMALDIGGIGGGIFEVFENLDYSGLHLLSTKVTIEITPSQGKGRKLTTTLSAANAEKLIGGTKPCTETYEQIFKAICERKGLQPPTEAEPGDTRDPAT